jgi:hypothetical protein
VVRIHALWIHLLKSGTGADSLEDGSASPSRGFPRRADPTRFRPEGREVIMDRAPCPQCGDDSTVAGWADKPDHAHFFQPDGIHWLRHLLRHFGQNNHVSLPDRLRACLTCGLIWNSLDAEQLRELVGRESVANGRPRRSTVPAGWPPALEGRSEAPS